VTRPESEDPYVFRDARKHFHLLTNVNNGHARCPEGVACGGHAWSEDGITWSDLVIGAYGPRIPLMNGTFWQVCVRDLLLALSVVCIGCCVHWMLCALDAVHVAVGFYVALDIFAPLGIFVALTGPTRWPLTSHCYWHPLLW
jgi:hypothetical protein